MSRSTENDADSKTLLDHSGAPIAPRPTLWKRLAALSRRVKILLVVLVTALAGIGAALTNLGKIQSFFWPPGLELVSAVIHSESSDIIALRKRLNDQGLSIPWSPPGVAVQLFQADFDWSNDRAWNRFPILDITVLNRGTSRTVLTKLSLDTTVTVLSEEPPLYQKHIPPTWNYNTLLDLDLERQHLHVPILDEVGPDETSRFLVTIGNNSPRVKADVVVVATLECTNGQQINLGTFKFTTEPHHPGVGSCLSVVQPLAQVIEPADRMHDYPPDLGP